MEQINMMWDEFNGGWVTPSKALANAFRIREFQMNLCKKYSHSLKWMGGYVVNSIQEVD